MGAVTASPKLLLGKGVAEGAGVAVLCQGRWHHSQPASGQWDETWDTGTSQCHPMKLSPQVTPHLKERQVPVPLGSASTQTLPADGFALQNAFPGKRGDGKRMLHPPFPRPALGCFPAPLGICCCFQTEQGSDAKPHGAAETGARPRFPLSVAPSPSRALGHVCPPPLPPRCHWVLLAVPRGRAPGFGG